MWATAADYVRSLDVDAWMVGGAVRDAILGRGVKDTDFVVPGVGQAELRALLEPHGRVEDLVVAGQRVGVRLFPREAAARALAPAGIEFAPPRVERSTGPGRHDFEIVADGEISLEQDMRRRDFTINAIAQRLSTGEILDPLDGRRDLARGVLRTVSANSFREDPLRIVRGLRFVSQLRVEPDDKTVRQMLEHAPQVRLVSAERIGGGLSADGMGELSKLLLGQNPLTALRLARDTGVLVEIVPEYERAIGYDLGSARQAGPLEEHMFAVVQAAADADAPLPVRLAALLHDLGKSDTQPGVARHAGAGARIAAAALRRLRYPTALREYVTRLCREHAFCLDEPVDERFARRFLRAHGDGLAFDLVAHKEADLRAKIGTDGELERAARLRTLLERERGRPHRLRDLVVDGGDLLELGDEAGPQLGRTLDVLLDEVVDDPSKNEREFLLARARELL